MTPLLALLLSLVLMIIVGFFIARKYFPSSLSYEQLSKFAHSSMIFPDSMHVNYRIQGNEEGQTILLLHGGYDSLAAWDPWMETLETDYKIVTVDFPGHGLTDPIELYSGENLARFIETFVDELGLGNFVIGGHSMGGYAALQYVLDNPGKATKLILVASGGYFPDEISEQEEKALALANSPWAKILKFSTTRESCRQGLIEFVHDPSVLPDWLVEHDYLLSRYKKNRGSRLKLISAMSTEYAEIEGLDTINIPTLILWGDRDETTPVDMAHRFDQDIPDSKLVVYKDVGHMVMLEAQEESVKEVISFLDED